MQIVRSDFYTRIQCIDIRLCVRVYMYVIYNVCVFVCVIYVCLFRFRYIDLTHAHIYTHIHVHAYIHTYHAYMHAYTHTKKKQGEATLALEGHTGKQSERGRAMHVLRAQTNTAPQADA